MKKDYNFFQSKFYCKIFIKILKVKMLKIITTIYTILRLITLKIMIKISEYKRKYLKKI